MLIQEEIARLLTQSLRDQDIRVDETEIEVGVPTREGFGDFSTSVIFSIAKREGLQVQPLGETTVSLLNTYIGESNLPILKVEQCNGGFINFYVDDVYFFNRLVSDGQRGIKAKNISGKNIVVEYTDPNPFKVFHIGHLMTNTIGESLARLFRFSGAHVRQVNYQGDVGMHVAKSVWGLRSMLSDDGLTIEQLAEKSLTERVAYMGEAYTKGANAFLDEPQIKNEIERVNTLCYIAAQELLVEDEGWEPVIQYRSLIEIDDSEYSEIRDLYRYGRSWSLEYFEGIYKTLGTAFDGYYFESKVGEYGLGLVHKHLDDGVFEKSEGAIVFKGEQYGLHTRVFINQKGLPVYEAKDLALAFMKKEDFDYDLSFVVTGNEIDEYFRVVLQALEQIHPDLRQKTFHLGHGMLKFSSGKMSSRSGNVVGGMELLDEIKDHVRGVMADERDLSGEDRELVVAKVAVGSWKYSVLKQQIGKDIIFDFKSSIALDGNSGPYLQYTYARAKSVMRKNTQATLSQDVNKVELTDKERKLLRMLDHFESVIVHAAQDHTPHTICTYLYDLAQSYNSFYNETQILVDDRDTRNFRLKLTEKVAEVLKDGLYTLGIETVERM
jgi:arginyl-tRNA synthetase